MLLQCLPVFPPFSCSGLPPRSAGCGPVMLRVSHCKVSSSKSHGIILEEGCVCFIRRRKSWALGVIHPAEVSLLQWEFGSGPEGDASAGDG